MSHDCGLCLAAAILIRVSHLLLQKHCNFGITSFRWHAVDIGLHAHIRRCWHGSRLAFGRSLTFRPGKQQLVWTSQSNASTSHELYFARFCDEPPRLLRRTAPRPCEHCTDPDLFFTVHACRTLAEMCTLPINQGMTLRSSALGRNAHNVTERDALCTLPEPPECSQHHAPLCLRKNAGARCWSRTSCVHVCMRQAR